MLHLGEEHKAQMENTDLGGRHTWIRILALPSTGFMVSHSVMLPIHRVATIIDGSNRQCLLTKSHLKRTAVIEHISHIRQGTEPFIL